MTDTAGARRADEVRRAKRARERSVLMFLRDIVIIFVVALLISFLVKTFLVRPFWIPSESMNDTLQVDDRIIVSLLTPGLSPLERGDVVVFKDPGGWLPSHSQSGDDQSIQSAIGSFLTFVGLTPEDDQSYLVKRVIGLPGDSVRCCNDYGQLEINGQAIREPYVRRESAEDPASSIQFDVTVPEDRLWLLGDNRDHSGDSRAHMDGPGGGFVPVEAVVGRAVVISWPVNRWVWLDRYSETFAGLEPQSGDLDDLRPTALPF